MMESTFKFKKDYFEDILPKSLYRISPVYNETLYLTEEQSEKTGYLKDIEKRTKLDYIVSVVCMKSELSQKDKETILRSLNKKTSPYITYVDLVVEYVYVLKEDDFVSSSEKITTKEISSALISVFEYNIEKMKERDTREDNRNRKLFAEKILSRLSIGRTMELIKSCECIVTDYINMIPKNFANRFIDEKTFSEIPIDGIAALIDSQKQTDKPLESDNIKREYEQKQTDEVVTRHEPTPEEIAARERLYEDLRRWEEQKERKRLEAYYNNPFVF